MEGRDEQLVEKDIFRFQLIFLPFLLPRRIFSSLSFSLWDLKREILKGKLLHRRNKTQLLRCLSCESCFCVFFECVIAGTKEQFNAGGMKRAGGTMSNYLGADSGKPSSKNKVVAAKITSIRWVFQGKFSCQCHISGISLDPSYASFYTQCRKL